MKKVFGIVLIGVGAMCSLAIVGQLVSILGVIINLFNSNLNANEKAQALGTVTFFVLLAAIAFFSLKYGMRLMRTGNNNNTVSTNEQTQSD